MTDITPITARLDHAIKWFEDCTLTNRQATDLRRHIDDLEYRIERLQESCKRLQLESYEARRELDRERLPA